MKDSRTLGINNPSSTAAEIYNLMDSFSETSPFEACRTMEAISCVRNYNHETLLKKIKEEDLI